jgi:RNA polymerase sigma-70 factor (ECF subfamily)
MAAEEVPSTDSLLTESSLLQRAQQSDVRAWQRLAALYTPLVYRWCRLHGLQPVDAENVGQDVLLTLYRSLPGFEIRPENGSFRGWLRTIVVNKVRDHARRMSQQAAAIGGSDALVILQLVADSDATLNEPHQEINLLFRRAVELIHSEFSERDWRVFQRVVIDDAAAQDVATEMDLTVNTVYLVKSRILRRLKTEFQGLID